MLHRHAATAGAVTRPSSVLRLLAVLALIATVVTACSSSSKSSNSNGSSSSSASTGGANAEAKAIVAKLEQVQPFPTLPPLVKKTSSDITVAFPSCVLPTCHADAATAAFKALGWKFTLIPWDISKGPTAFTTALDQAIAMKPDYLVTNGIFPQATYQTELDKAHSLKIPVVSVGGALTSDFVGCFECSGEYTATGALAAQIAEVDAGGNPKMIATLDPNVNPLLQSFQGAQAQLAKDGGSITQVKVSSNNTQAANNQAVISYLQSHPDVKYVFTTTDDYSAGLPAALSQVGLKVKIIAGSGLASDYPAVKDGDLFALIGNESEMGQWRAADLLARLSVGMTIPADQQAPAGWLQIVTKQNVDSMNPTVLQPTNYQQSFTTLWNAG